MALQSSEEFEALCTSHIKRRRVLQPQYVARLCAGQKVDEDGISQSGTVLVSTRPAHIVTRHDGATSWQSVIIQPPSCTNSGEAI